jgi:hypothetical protein
MQGESSRERPNEAAKKLILDGYRLIRSLNFCACRRDIST